MKSKSGKVMFVVMAIISIAFIYWFKNYGPLNNQNSDAKKKYQTYVKTEATIVSQEGNGRVGKGAATIWTIQFQDQQGTLQTAKMNQSTFFNEKNGDKTTIYYNPSDPNEVSSEEDYKEIMK